MSSKKKKKKSSPKVIEKQEVPFRKTGLYRFLVITLVFALIGVGAFSWIVGSGANSVFLWVMVGVFIAAYLATLIVVHLMVLRGQGNLNREYFKARWHSFWQAFGSFFKH